MTFDDAVIEWLRSNGHVPEGTVEVVLESVEHEDGWVNEDSGTSWPSETVITYRTVKVGPQGQRHSKTRTVHLDTSDPYDFTRQLFAIAEK